METETTAKYFPPFKCLVHTEALSNSIQKVAMEFGWHWGFAPDSNEPIWFDQPVLYFEPDGKILHACDLTHNPEYPIIDFSPALVIEYA